jgi:hypothetical protein
MACERVDAVICETEEQAEVLRIYNPKVFPILDFHEEFPFIRGDRSGKERIPKIFWEGLPFTSPGLQICVEALKKAKVNHGAKLEMVTDLTYPKFLGRYFESSTLKLNNPVHSALGSNFSIKSWSIDQVVKSASQSNMAILPIDEKSNLARLKAENRLLIMWRLGLPTLVSPTLAYRRVMERAGIDGICNDSWEWQQKIECLLEDKDVRSANISKGQHYLNTHHNKEILMSKWDYFLEETL